MVGMERRILANAISALAFTNRKIALLSGPRQCGKTTLARMLANERAVSRYYNWDDASFRRIWTKTPSSIIPAPKGKDIPLVVLDEIHKDRLWKRNLKGIYDTLSSPCDLLVTGSARLNVYRRGGDSLAGRYFHFRLHPFSLREMETNTMLSPDEAIDSLFSRAQKHGKERQRHFEALMRHGPFPEPLFAQNARHTKLWRQAHEQAVIREDLRDISRLRDLGRLEMMASLIPERVGAPFSIANLREDMEVSFDTIGHWLTYLKELYYIFDVKPWAKRIPRSLRREGKVYLWDYGAVEDEAARFENLVAAHLLKMCHYWTDTGEGEFELFYLRDKDKREIDFLVVRDGTPWLPVEAKLSDTTPSPNWKRFAPFLPCRRAVQIVRQPHWELHDYGGSQVLVAGAAQALAYLG